MFTGILILTFIDNVLRQWTKEAEAQLAEYKVFELLKNQFYGQPCLLIANFNENNLCRLAQDTLSYKRKDKALSEEVNIFSFEIIYMHDLRI